MYHQRFGLVRRPFPTTPDCTCYYPSTGHEEALSTIVEAVDLDEGIALLTGEAGVGKTLLCHCLMERMSSGCTIAFLTNSHIETRRDLLQAVLYDLSLPYETGTAVELRLRLTDFLLSAHAAGAKTLLLIDEAHQLSADALEELRLLCNLEAGRRKAVQIVLVAQPSIRTTLGMPQLKSLSQRLVVRTGLGSFEVEEAVDYLLHHLRIAGGKPDVIFTDEALEMLAKGANGIPRMLNQSAHQALLLAHRLDMETVDAEVAQEVLEQLGLSSGGKIDSQIEERDSVAPADDVFSAESEQDVLSYRMFEAYRRPA